MGAARSYISARLPPSVMARLRAVKRYLVRADWIDEAEIFARVADERGMPSGSMLVDVGAHCGAVTALFLDKGWSVVAYEPDPINRERFKQHIGPNPRVKLSDSAVSDKAAESVSLFTSPVSTGVSTLAPFHESHTPTCKIRVVTLADDLRARGIRYVDFLKIDIEGFDYFALRGFDWDYAPRFVLYEFEDRKTVPLGYSLSDSSGYMAGRGYHIVYSIWEPIVEYGMQHRWRGLFLTPPSDIESCWGNVLCFREKDDAALCMATFSPRTFRLF